MLTARLSRCALIALGCLALGLPACARAQQGEAGQPQVQRGIAAQFPGDEGIENHPSVLFVEKFEAADIQEVIARWSSSSGNLALDEDTAPGSPGSRSLRMTVTRGEGSTTQLYKAINPGAKEMYARFYVKFAEDHGYTHHFSNLRGTIAPAPEYAMHRSGNRPEDRFIARLNQTGTPPPGRWYYYVYYPHMRSHQNEDGTPDAENPQFWGNTFMPRESVQAERGEWICVELHVKLNSAPDVSDGELSFYIDGRRIGHWAPGTPQGYFIRDRFVAEHPAERGREDRFEYQPFPGITWYSNPENFDQFEVNQLRLLHYVTENAFARSQSYAEENPGANVNTRQATVWYDHVIVATEYIGPMAPGQAQE